MTDLINIQAKTPAEMADKVVKLKELKKQVDAKLKELSNGLLESMKEFDVLTLKTGQLTITRQSRTTCSIEDLEELKGFCEDRKLYFKTKEVADDITVNQVKEIVKTGQEVDGVEVKNTEYVVIKATKVKK
jgi:hypothetical protein